MDWYYSPTITFQCIHSHFCSHWVSIVLILINKMYNNYYKNRLSPQLN